MSFAAAPLSPSRSPGARPTYPYSAPNEAEIRLAVARQVGAAAMETVWDAARLAIGARRDGAALTHEQLGAIARHLARQAGPLRIVGRSLELRLRTFALLSATAALVPPATPA